jgi:hypothetical protein
VHSSGGGRPTAIQADAKKPAAPPPNPNITEKKATMATGSSSSGSGGSTVTQADAEKAPKAMPEAAKEVVAAVEEATTATKVVHNTTLDPKEAVKKAMMAIGTSNSGGGGSDAAQTNIEKALDVTPDSKTVPKRAAMAMGRVVPAPLPSDSAPLGPARAPGMSQFVGFFSSSFCMGLLTHALVPQSIESEHDTSS